MSNESQRTNRNPSPEITPEINLEEIELTETHP